MRILKLMFASVAAATLLSASAAQSADPVKIRLSWVAPVTNWASILLEKKDLAQHLGKSYTLEPVRFAGTPPMVTALANGELEVANLAYSRSPSQFRMPAWTICASSPTNSAMGSKAIIRRNTWCSRTGRSRKSTTSRARW